jgi:hypothetical protein
MRCSTYLVGTLRQGSCAGAAAAASVPVRMSLHHSEEGMLAAEPLVLSPTSACLGRCVHALHGACALGGAATVEAGACGCLGCAGKGQGVAGKVGAAIQGANISGRWETGWVARGRPASSLLGDIQCFLLFRFDLTPKVRETQKRLAASWVTPP